LSIHDAHGPAAFTLNPRPFNLQVHVPAHASGEVYYWIANGIPGTPMPGWADKLSDTERWQIVRFLQALAAGRAP
jgi:copper resistance protein D